MSNAACPTCAAPILVVAMDTRTQQLYPNPDPEGTVEIRRSGPSYRGRYTGARTPACNGWEKYRTHDCGGTK